MLDNNEPLSVVCWLWGDKYPVEHVNKLYRGFAKNYDLPFNFFCFTDQPDNPEFIPEVQTLQIPTEHAKTKRCARRLKIFSLEMRDIIGSRILQLDVDMVIVGNITELLSTHEEFKIWKSPSNGEHSFAYNPSLMLMNVGCRKHIWRLFNKDPKTALKEAQLNKWTGSDQAVIGNLLRKNEAVWDEKDGIYSFRDEISVENLPENAKIVGFYDDFDMNKLDIPWLKEHWA